MGARSTPIGCASATRSLTSPCASCPPASACAASPRAQVSVYGIRKDGFTGPIKLSLRNPPPGFSAEPASLTGTQEVARLTIKTTLAETAEPVRLDRGGQGKGRRAGSLARCRAGGRPHAGIPMAAPGSRRGTQGAGLQPLSGAAAQARPARAPTFRTRDECHGRRQACRRRGSPSSPNSRWPGGCGN